MGIVLAKTLLVVVLKNFATMRSSSNFCEDKTYATSAVFPSYDNTESKSDSKFNIIDKSHSSNYASVVDDSHSSNYIELAFQNVPVIGHSMSIGYITTGNR